MENLVFTLAFVNGIVLTISCYFTYMAVVVRGQYEEMLGQQANLQNQQTVENASLREKIEDLERAIFDVEKSMEEDKYKDVSEQARKVAALEKVVENHAKQFALNEGTKKETFEAMGRLAQQIKKFGDDPSLVRGY